MASRLFLSLMVLAIVAATTTVTLVVALSPALREDTIVSDRVKDLIEAGRDVDDLDDPLDIDDRDVDNDRDDGDALGGRRVPSWTGTGSCHQARLCCEGRDASCVVSGRGRGGNSIIDDPNAACYCDHACMAVGDCCRDYRRTCGVQHCVVSDWGAWSDCDVQCGMGTSSRKRQVLQSARNGGRECPELTQKRGCHSANCEVSRAALKASRETALILASTYSSLRTVNESRDIRWNLKLAYPKDPVKESQQEYCVVFEVIKSRKSCDLQLPESASRLLQPESRVCVACQSAAWRKHLGYRCHGHGVDDRPTRWSAVSGSNCHGRWVRRGAFRECPCHADGRPDFIFV